MMRMIFVFCFILALGCARVSLKTPEPIRVDINMRVDVYQHVAKDVDSIESQIYSKEEQINAIFSLQNVYAEDYSEEVSIAIERRKGRVEKVEDYFKKGYVGENRDAHLKLMDENIPSGIRKEVENIIKDENKDRETIYKYTASKNGVDVLQARKVFFQDHYRRAAAGYWFEVYNDKEEKFNWEKK